MWYLIYVIKVDSYIKSYIPTEMRITIALHLRHSPLCYLHSIDRSCFKALGPLKSQIVKNTIQFLILTLTPSIKPLGLILVITSIRLHDCVQPWQWLLDVNSISFDIKMFWVQKVIFLVYYNWNHRNLNLWPLTKARTWQKKSFSNVSWGKGCTQTHSPCERKMCGNLESKVVLQFWNKVWRNKHYSNWAFFRPLEKYCWIDI